MNIDRRNEGFAGEFAVLLIVSGGILIFGAQDLSCSLGQNTETDASHVSVVEVACARQDGSSRIDPISADAPFDALGNHGLAGISRDERILQYGLNRLAGWWRRYSC